MALLITPYLTMLYTVEKIVYLHPNYLKNVTYSFWS